MNRNFIPYLIAIALVPFLFGCKEKSNKVSVIKDSVFVFHHEPANAVYFWKTVMNINNYEMNFMKMHRIKRMYVKFFDVGTDNLYDGQGEQPVPIATLVFMDEYGNTSTAKYLQQHCDRWRNYVWKKKTGRLRLHRTY